MVRRLILASASPRRRGILTELGIEFELVVPQVEERSGPDAADVVLENARRKARAGLRKARETIAPNGELTVLGCDTDVVVDGRTLGKASGEPEARSRLEALSGRSHEVLSGLALLDAGVGGDRSERSGVARTSVTFRDLAPDTIDLYLRSGEWRGRAGAYAIQGLGSILVERVEGDVANVIGLPVALLIGLAPELVARS